MAKQNRKRRAASRIESIRSKLDERDTRLHLQSFLTDYFLCEMACKEMIVGYKDSIGNPVKYADVKMDSREIKDALNHYGVALEDRVRNRLFSSNSKSAKKIRDSLVHSMTKTNLETLNNQYAQMMADMSHFLNAVTEDH